MRKEHNHGSMGNTKDNHECGQHVRELKIIVSMSNQVVITSRSTTQAMLVLISYYPFQGIEKKSVIPPPSGMIWEPTIPPRPCSGSTHQNRLQTPVHQIDLGPLPVGVTSMLMKPKKAQPCPRSGGSGYISGNGFTEDGFAGTRPARPNLGNWGI